MTFSTIKLSLILSGLAQMLKYQARRHPAFQARLKERNFVAQIMARDEECGRWFAFKDGKVRSGSGLHAKPDCKLMFKNAAIGVELSLALSAAAVVVVALGLLVADLRAIPAADGSPAVPPARAERGNAKEAAGSGD